MQQNDIFSIFMNSSRFFDSWLILIVVESIQKEKIYQILNLDRI